MSEPAYLVEVLRNKMSEVEKFLASLRLKSQPIKLASNSSFVVALDRKQLQEVTDNDFVSRVSPNNTHYTPK